MLEQIIGTYDEVLGESKDAEELIDFSNSKISSSIQNAPYVAIGTAKELIETCCRQILIEREKLIDKGWDLIQLVKHTNKELQLTPEDIADEKQASKTSSR